MRPDISYPRLCAILRYRKYLNALAFVLGMWTEVRRDLGAILYRCFAVFVLSNLSTKRVLFLHEKTSSLSEPTFCS